jgi:hypothetical protein
VEGIEQSRQLEALEQTKQRKLLLQLDPELRTCLPELAAVLMYSIEWQTR